MGIQSHPAPKQGKEDPPKKKKLKFSLRKTPPLNPTRHTHPPHSNSDHMNSHTQKTQNTCLNSQNLFCAFCLYVCLSVFRRRTRAAEESLSAFLRFNSSHLRTEGFTTSQSLFCCCASASSSRRRLWGLCTLDFWNGGRLLLRM